MNPENLTYKDATHNLKCSHKYNWSSAVKYHMRCVILKELPDNRAKILVFGDRRRKIELCEGKKRIRYVSRDRLVKLEKDGGKKK